jgi:hypothetical protein
LVELLINVIQPNYGYDQVLRGQELDGVDWELKEFDSGTIEPLENHTYIIYNFGRFIQKAAADLV